MIFGLYLFTDDELLDAISSAYLMINATVQSFRIKDASQKEDVADLLDFVAAEDSIQKQFLVACEVKCLYELLSQVNSY